MYLMQVVAAVTGRCGCLVIISCPDLVTLANNIVLNFRVSVTVYT